MIDNFIIICISDCNPLGLNNSYKKLLVRKGQKFKISTYNYNYKYKSDYFWLPNIGIIDKKNFKKLSEYRKDRIFDILK